MYLFCFNYEAFPIIYVITQNFDDPAFPPAGWLIETTGSGGSWIWTDIGQPGNGYAHGSVNLVNPSQSGSAMLISNNFFVPAQVPLWICFYCRNNWTGSEPSSCSWEVSLRIGTYVWFSLPFQPLPDYPDWSSKLVLCETETSSDQYNVTWRVIGNYGIAPSYIYFDIDHVDVHYNNTSVEPASLGQIKTTYK